MSFSIKDMKKVLFISTTFNTYYKDIIETFKDNHFSVDWYSDRPSNSIASRALIRINPKLLKNKIKKYEKKILEETKNTEYDLVFVILGQSFTDYFWKELRNNQKKAKFIYYLWDSSSNFKCIINNYMYFDKTYSFDKNDCNQYGFSFLPLFYTTQFDVENRNINPKFDYSYIGTVKPGRYDKVNQILSQLDKHKMCGFKYFYLHSKKVLSYYKLKYKKEFKKVNVNDLNYELLSKEKCFEFENDSKIIVDVQQPGQLGLTIRTFEAMGMKKKLITTNADVENYDFYNENNIYIIKDGKIDFNNIFFHSDYMEINEIRKKYSISNWLMNLIGEIL